MTNSTSVDFFLNLHLPKTFSFSFFIFWQRRPSLNTFLALVISLHPVPTTSVLSALSALIIEETSDLGLVLQAVDKHFEVLVHMMLELQLFTT